MRRHLLALPLSLAFAASLTACEVGGQPCTDLFAFGLSVTVTDATDGAAICDAVVTASEGTFEEVLQVQGDGADCVYVGAGERAGTYRIEAVKDGYTTLAEDNVVVGEDECHVIGEQVSLALTAS